MSDGNTEVKCTRCGTLMTLDQQPYAIPFAVSRGPKGDEPTFSPTQSRTVQLFQCPSPDCRSIELKVPDRWPSPVAAGH